MRASQWLREKPDIFPYKANACRTEDKTSKRRTCPPFAGRLVTLSHAKFTWRTVDAFVVRGTELRHSSAVQWDYSRTRSILRDVRWESKAVRFRLFFYARTAVLWNLRILIITATVSGMSPSMQRWLRLPRLYANYFWKLDYMNVVESFAILVCKER